MDKSLKKLSRVELLELMVNLSEDYERLRVENARLRKMVSQQRLPRSAKVGSIAEAALQANGYFEAAQRSADEYLKEIKHLRDELASRSNAAQNAAAAAGARQAEYQAQATLRDAQLRADQIVARANAQAEAVLADAKTRAEGVLAQANQQARAASPQGAPNQRAAVQASPLVQQPVPQVQAAPARQQPTAGSIPQVMPISSYAGNRAYMSAAPAYAGGTADSLQAAPAGAPVASAQLQRGGQAPAPSSQPAYSTGAVADGRRVFADVTTSVSAQPIYAGSSTVAQQAHAGAGAGACAVGLTTEMPPVPTKSWYPLDGGRW